jgi:cell division septation protein DedD
MAAVCAAGLFAAPALADVKAGVDAWGRGDYDAAVREWRPAAINGDRDAQFNIGQAYKLGRGVPQDLAQAEDWYRKAAIQGHEKAEDNYGLVLFQSGKRSDALPWIEKSAARGEPRAQYILGTALFNGDGMSKDWVRAYALMTRASAAGLAPASTSLAQMDKYVPMEQRQKGLKLAGELETAARRPQIATAPTPRNPLPVSTPARPVSRDVDVPASTPTEGPAPVPVYTPDRPGADFDKPAPAPVRVAAPAPARPAASGNWRIQLGAFSQQNRAETLWDQLEGRYGALASLQPYLVNTGAVTKLQAGPFASEAAATRACSSLRAGGQACIAVPKGR